MYLIPLSQFESVALLVHSLKAAAGDADCSMCPAFKVCMKQCLVIAGSIERMLEQGTLPQFSQEGSGPEDDSPPSSPLPPSEKSGLRIVK